MALTQHYAPSVFADSLKHSFVIRTIPVMGNCSDLIRRVYWADGSAGLSAHLRSGSSCAVAGAGRWWTEVLGESKGLEVRAVAVMACDSEVVPLQSRVESITDEADLEEVYNTERNLLYVARARAHLLVICVGPASEFLDDLEG